MKVASTIRNVKTYSLAFLIVCFVGACASTGASEGVTKSQNEFDGTVRWSSGEHDVELQNYPGHNETAKAAANGYSGGPIYYYLTFKGDISDWLLLDLPEEAAFLVDDQRFAVETVTIDGNVNNNATVTEYVQMQFDREKYQKIANAQEARFRLSIGNVGATVPSSLQKDMRTILDTTATSTASSGQTP